MNKQSVIIWRGLWDLSMILVHTLVVPSPAIPFIERGVRRGLTSVIQVHDEQNHHSYQTEYQRGNGCDLLTIHTFGRILILNEIIEIHDFFRVQFTSSLKNWENHVHDVDARDAKTRIDAKFVALVSIIVRKVS